MKQVLFLIPLAFSLQFCSSQTNKKTAMDSSDEKNPVYSHTDTAKVTISDDEWKKILPEDVYYIARMKGTERPGTSPYEHSKEKGNYYCAACGNALFVSGTKF